MSITDFIKIVKVRNTLVITSVFLAIFVGLLRRRNAKQSTEIYFTSTNDKIKKIPLIVITGCDTGLGYSIVMRYLNNNYCNINQNYCKTFNLPMFSSKQLIVPNKIAIVAFCLNPQGPGAKNLLQLSMTNSRIDLFVRQLDLTDNKSIQNGITFLNDLLEHSMNEIGQDNAYELHALVNNAARMVMGEFEWQTSDMIRSQFDVNILGPMMLTTQLLPNLRKDKSRIINVISHCAYLPLPGISIYGATKSAVRSWSDGLRVELKNHGVQVITFLPGSFYLHSSIMSGNQRKIDFNKMRENMNKEQLWYYGAYIDAYENYLASIDQHMCCSETTIPSTNTIYYQMDKALWTISPKPKYSVPDPWRYKIYYSIALILSIFGLYKFRDKVVRMFVNTPQFKNNVASQEKNN